MNVGGNCSRTAGRSCGNSKSAPLHSVVVGQNLRDRGYFSGSVRSHNGDREQLINSVNPISLPATRTTSGRVPRKRGAHRGDRGLDLTRQAAVPQFVLRGGSSQTHDLLRAFHLAYRSGTHVWPATSGMLRVPSNQSDICPEKGTQQRVGFTSRKEPSPDVIDLVEDVTIRKIDQQHVVAYPNPSTAIGRRR